jgi:hypothetical protein
MRRFVAAVEMKIQILKIGVPNQESSDVILKGGEAGVRDRTWAEASMLRVGTTAAYTAWKSRWRWWCWMRFVGSLGGLSPSSG